MRLFRVCAARFEIPRARRRRTDVDIRLMFIITVVPYLNKFIDIAAVYNCVGVVRSRTED